MSTSPDTDPFRLAMEAVAIDLMGEPTQRRNGGREMRWGNRGSMSVDLDKGAWIDRERNVGGGTLALVMDQLPADKAGATAYMHTRGHLPDRERSKPNGPNGTHHAPAARRIVATYDYTDAHGELLFQVVRYHPKDFRQRRPDGKGGWVWKLTVVGM